ncbi:MAG: hypothetical protein M3Z08_20190, partial [Chloroflexota bacterium]|nr:hypothetical protein [Chloroflexota bacterium]
RMPSSTRRYPVADVKTEVGRARPDVVTQHGYGSAHTDRHTAIPARRAATQTTIPAAQVNRQRTARTDDVETRPSGSLRVGSQRPRPHWLVIAGMGMLVMLVAWVALSSLVSWWQVTQDDWKYGRPRTFQMDYVVSHNDSVTNKSHFMAINLNRRIEIIEFPGGDPTKAKIYLGPLLVGDGQDLTPVTLTFKDVNGDGKPDMIVNVQDSHFVFINENGTFRAARPGENLNMS